MTGYAISNKRAAMGRPPLKGAKTVLLSLPAELPAQIDAHMRQPGRRAEFMRQAVDKALAAFGPSRQRPPSKKRAHASYVRQTVRLPASMIDAVDALVGPRGRSTFISDAIQWALEEPAVLGHGEDDVAVRVRIPRLLLEQLEAVSARGAEGRDSLIAKAIERLLADIDRGPGGS